MYKLECSSNQHNDNSTEYQAKIFLKRTLPCQVQNSSMVKLNDQGS